MKPIITILALTTSISAFASSPCELQKKNYFFFEKERSYNMIEKSLNQKGYKLVEKSNLSLEEMRVDGDGSSLTRSVLIWLWDKNKEGDHKLIQELRGKHTSTIFTGVTESTLRKAFLKAIEQLPICE